MLSLFTPNNDLLIYKYAVSFHSGPLQDVPQLWDCGHPHRGEQHCCWGQGNPRISCVVVLSRSKKSESTQNHFESFRVGIPESHGLEHCWAMPNAMLRAICLLISICCFCTALTSVVTFTCPWCHCPSDLPSVILHVHFESIWVILPEQTCHFPCSLWVVLSHSPRAKISSWIA